MRIVVSSFFFFSLFKILNEKVLSKGYFFFLTLIFNLIFLKFFIRYTYWSQQFWLPVYTYFLMQILNWYFEFLFIKLQWKSCFSFLIVFKCFVNVNCIKCSCWYCRTMSLQWLQEIRIKTVEIYVVTHHVNRHSWFSLIH